MWFDVLLLIILSKSVNVKGGDDEPVLYYYGLEESERGLGACGARAACAALLARSWRAPALLRLCRCGRRRRCDVPAPANHTIEINNRARLQFCNPVTSWPVCSASEPALRVISERATMNPDELDFMHHQGTYLTPPNITFSCRCREPNSWKLARTESETSRVYRCSSLPLCKTGEFCGNFNYEFNSLYQSCLCPRRHICVHNGGMPFLHISELLYEGLGWKAYCQRIDEEDSYEEY